jgi:hypothetical protein
VSQQINLFNPIFLKQKKYFSALTMLQALGMILLGCILLGAYLSYQSSLLKREVDMAAARLNAAQAQLTQLTAIGQTRRQDKTLDDKIKQAEAQVESVQRAFTILQRGDLGNTSGYSEYFRAFARRTVPGVWLTGLTLNGAGNDIAIDGRALRPDLVPDYLARLKQEPAMRGKSFAGLELRTPAPEQPAAANTLTPAAAPAPAPATPPAYIEFRLHGTLAANDQAGAPRK